MVSAVSPGRGVSPLGVSLSLSGPPKSSQIENAFAPYFLAANVRLVVAPNSRRNMGESCRVGGVDVLTTFPTCSCINSTSPGAIDVRRLLRKTLYPLKF